MRPRQQRKYMLGAFQAAVRAWKRSRGIDVDDEVASAESAEAAEAVETAQPTEDALDKKPVKIDLRK